MDPIHSTSAAPTRPIQGFQTASHMFVTYTIAKFQAVQQLHIILLVVTLMLALLFVVRGSGHTTGCFHSIGSNAWENGTGSC